MKKQIGSPLQKTIPLGVVGSSTFGRYPKISNAMTYNMIVSDNWFVPFAGHQEVATLAANGSGRGLYSSVRYNHMIAVVNDNVYTIDSNFGVAKIATIGTSFGDVFIAENNAKQIAICDLKNIYIFDYDANTFTRATIDFLPTAISFQDGRFISGDRRNNQWRLSDFNNGLSWPGDASSVGVIQTKPDTVSYPLPIKGKGNALFLIGKTVTEQWYDLGYQLFPYQRNSFFNIDYGCLSAATVASQEDLVVWLAANEQSGPVIMVSQGGAPMPLSTDGINFKLAQLTTPQDSYGFIFKQDGHTFYQITFPTDNLTLLYDFNTKKFYHLCDKYMNYHIAKRVCFFNDAYYFVSFNDGKLYEINSDYTTYNGDEIPRIRVTDPYRLPDSTAFIVNNINFTVEQGESQTVQRIDVSMSKDGAQSFSNIFTQELNSTANRRNKFQRWNLGRANDFTLQFRFWSEGRFVVGDGTMSIYQ
jgi:hypothetical protein